MALYSPLPPIAFRSSLKKTKTKTKEGKEGNAVFEMAGKSST